MEKETVFCIKADLICKKKRKANIKVSSDFGKLLLKQNHAELSKTLSNGKNMITNVPAQEKQRTLLQPSNEYTSAASDISSLP